MRKHKYITLLAGTLLALAPMAQAQQAKPRAVPGSPVRVSTDGPITYPATLYWGGYHNMAQLVAPGAQWDFVKQNMDGFLFHFGYWLNNDFRGKEGDPIAVGTQLGQMLTPRHKKYMMEIGWPGGASSDGAFDDMGGRAASTFVAKIKKFEGGTGIALDEVSAELRLFVYQQTADHYPAYAPADVFATVTGAPTDTGRTIAHPYWPTFIAGMNKGLPGVDVNLTCPPIYLKWDNFWAAGPDIKYKDRPQADTVKFNARVMFESLFATNTTGYIADSPNYLLINPDYVRLGYPAKLLTMQTWLRAHHKKFSYIVNQGEGKALAPDQWDEEYKQSSLHSLQGFQALGGRADRYILESWYSGPHAIVPETKEGSFTNLVRDAIKYLKGPGETLSLTAGAPSMSPQGRVRTVTLTNRGDVACMPVLSASSSALRVQYDSKDITADSVSPAGYVLTGLVAPGARVIFTAVSPRGAGPLKLNAYWNPQDPSRKPRAAVILR